MRGWTFYAARQPSEDLNQSAINIGDESYTALQFWVTPEIDEEDELVHLAAWSPAFLNLEKSARLQILFLWLDEALGEDRVTNRLGKIEIRDDVLGPSFPITELRSFLDETEVRLGWKQPGPVHMNGFSCKEPSDDYPRADIIAGHTSQPALWRDYLRARGEMGDPLKGSGAAYYFLKIPVNAFPTGQHTQERFRLEDLLCSTLPATGNGQCLGSGGGKQFGYIDFLLFDGIRSIDGLMQILRADGALKQATLHHFAGDPAKVVARL